MREKVRVRVRVRERVGAADVDHKHRQIPAEPIGLFRAVNYSTVIQLKLTSSSYLQINNNPLINIQLSFL